jgi:SAM-dependent methyltransferase
VNQIDGGRVAALARRLSTRSAVRRIRPLAAKLFSGIESLVWGGRTREALLHRLLQGYYASRFRRDWVYPSEPPHFFDQRISWYFAGFGRRPSGPYSLFRGFYSADVVRPGDLLLDIGCGDGFYTERFYSTRCAAVDAIDIEPEAIAHARARHSADNIRYHLLDAVTEPFPGSSYDVVVWDGAIGHFSGSDSARMLKKIRRALAPGGVFVGSESLGVEGSDHLQFFGSLTALRQILSEHFRFIQLKRQDYEILGGQKHSEGYWRCFNDEDRMLQHAWRNEELEVR